MNANKNISEKKKQKQTQKKLKKHTKKNTKADKHHTTQLQCAARYAYAAQRSDVRSSGSGSSGDRDDDV